MNQTSSIIQYAPAVEAIKTAILQGQYEAAKGVTRIQLAVYFSIGKYISEHTRTKAWGSHALEIISKQLQKELPGLCGYSETQMKEMRLFYEAWSFLDSEKSSDVTDETANGHNAKISIAENMCDSNSSDASDELANAMPVVKIISETIDIHHAITIPDIEFPVEEFFQVPFSHHCRIASATKELAERYYYIHRVVEEHLSYKHLKQLVKDGAHKHQGQISNNFTRTIRDSREARKAVMMFKDDYMLNFINVEQIEEREKIDVDERVIENEIVKNIKDFIMTFGHDFTFVGNQYHLEVYGVEQFPDLLFFNRELNALVVVELKMGEFKTSYLGQLFGYLQILDDHVRKPHENQPIGIVLCQEANRAYAEYAVRDYSKPMGVATYKTLDEMPEQLRNALPDMQKMLEFINSKKS